MPDYIFQSPRLGFRNWSKDDIDPFAELNADPEVMTYFPRPFTFDETRNSVLRFQKYYTDYGYTFYAVDRLDTAEFIGFIGMIHQTFESFFTPCVEIGWRLKRPVWGKGYATEGAKACLNYGFDALGFSEIYSITAIPNLRSERVMQRIGMEKIGEFDHPSIEDGHPLERHVIYRIKK